jgi:hypothetical protein
MIAAAPCAGDGHSLDSILDVFLHDHPDAHRLRAAWQGVRRFIDDARVPAMRQPDAAALLLAKALDACGLKDDARWLAAHAPSAMPLDGCLPLRDLSNATLCALAVGVLRIVPDSALAPGTAIAIDPARLRGGVEWELDFAAVPALRGLMRDAVRILDAQPQPGLILARARCAMTQSPQAALERLAMLEETFAQLAAGRAHRFIWID